MVNRSEVEEVEDKKRMQEERELKEKNMMLPLGFFDKSTLVWLTLGLVIGHLPFLGGNDHHICKALLQAPLWEALGLKMWWKY